MRYEMHENIQVKKSSLLNNITVIHFMHDVAVERRIPALYKINNKQDPMH